MPRSPPPTTTTMESATPHDDKAVGVTVVEAVSHAVSLMEQFADQDPDAPDSPWRNPQAIFAQLDEARKQVMRAWQQQQQLLKQQQQETQQNQDLDESACRAMYLDMITDAFADVLDDLRQDDLRQDDTVDVTVLVDCLQSGLDFLSQEEREIFLQENDMEADDDDDDETTTMLTPHEKRRLELGFDDIPVIH